MVYYGSGLKNKVSAYLRGDRKLEDVQISLCSVKADCILHTVLGKWCLHLDMQMPLSTHWNRSECHLSEIMAIILIQYHVGPIGNSRDLCVIFLSQRPGSYVQLSK